MRAGKRAGTALPACPLMHGTGLFIALSTLSGGGTVVLIDEVGLDPDTVWIEVERKRVAVLTIVGDVFARPLLAALDAEPAPLGPVVAARDHLVGRHVEPGDEGRAHAPRARRTLLDSLGVVGGNMTPLGVARPRRDDRAGPFRGERPGRGARRATGEARRPGSDEIGMLGVGGPIPLGYCSDPEKTAATFRVVDGVRWSIPGDYAPSRPTAR